MASPQKCFDDKRLSVALGDALGVSTPRSANYWQR